MAGLATVTAPKDDLLGQRADPNERVRHGHDMEHWMEQCNLA